MLAPIVLFTYNRLLELKKTIESLKKCNLYNESKIFIYSDGPKNIQDKKKVEEIRNYLINEKNLNSNIDLIFKERNEGLANSVIFGVTNILKNYKKVIVLEDDLIVAENFLEYMNKSLEVFENRKDIWSISGYSPNLELVNFYNKDIFLSVRGCSWGWGTWLDRWENIEWELEDFKVFFKNSKNKKKFNLGGNDMYKMLELQYLKKIDSWAIRWCYNQFKQNKYTVYPIKSLVNNIGFGKDATHGGIFYKKYINKIATTDIKIDKDIKLDKRIIRVFKKNYDLSFSGKIGYFLKKYNIFYKEIKNIIKLFIN